MTMIVRAFCARDGLGAAALAAAASLLAACGGGGGYGGTTGPPPTAATVQATPSLQFTPAQVTVANGKSVTWAFGSVTHNVTFDRPAKAEVAAAAEGGGDYPGGPPTGGGAGGDAPADIPNSANQSVSRTFATAGTFHYHCTNHPTMEGTVTVQ